MKDLKEIKLAVASYSMHSPFVRKMINTWTSSSMVNPHDGIQLVSVTLEDGLKL